MKNQTATYEDAERKFVVSFTDTPEKLEQLKKAKARGVTIEIPVETTKGRVEQLLSDHFTL